MKKCIFPGSFDTITNAHLDVIERASLIFDEVVVAILINPNKKCMFSEAQRVKFCKLATAKFDNVKVITFSGFLVDLCKALDIRIVVRGVRDSADYEYERNYAISNFALDNTIEILWIPTRNEFLYVSSSLVRELILSGRSPAKFVPLEILDGLTLEETE